MGELEALQNKIRGLDLAIELLSSVATTRSTTIPRARGISDTIRSLLREAGAAGLTVQRTVELATEGGQPVNKTSVSSLLSRMKRDGEVVYKGKKYFLK